MFERSYQRVFLPRGQVQCGVVQTFDKISQTWYIHFILHSLKRTNKQILQTLANWKGFDHKMTILFNI